MQKISLNRAQRPAVLDFTNVKPGFKKMPEQSSAEVSGQFGMAKSVLSPKLRRTHSLIISRCIHKSQLRAHFSKTRSLSTASSPTKDDSLAKFERKHTKEIIKSRLMEALQEDKDLTISQGDEMLGSTAQVLVKPVHRSKSYESVMKEEEELPFKVFSKHKCANHKSVGDYGSCHAVKTAVAQLFNMDDFQLTKIGEGFFSEVFKVVHKSKGNVMVLKRNKHRSNRASMLKEIQLMNSLRHENILRYEGACVHEGQLHALAEYINGGSLDLMILQEKNDPPDFEFSWNLKLTLARDIAKGMDYLHSEGFFHRDLTSKNILIRVDDQRKPVSAVVADFGLAHKIPKSENGKPGKVYDMVGSPYWMAPECLRGQGYNESSDVFAFGIILCEIIALVDADPDFLPRTENFGVDYVSFSELVPFGCPPDFLRIAFACVTVDTHRPTFKDLASQLGDLNIQLKSKPDGVETTTKISTHPGSGSGRARKNATVSRRCHSQRLQERLFPSEVACLHTSMAAQWRNAKDSPADIGEEMSRLDRFYIPSPATGINPFVQLLDKLNTLAGGKIYSSKDLFYSCFELFGNYSDGNNCNNPMYRKAMSMIHQVPVSMAELHGIQTDFPE